MTPLEKIRDAVAEIIKNTYCIDAPEMEPVTPVVVLTPYMRDEVDGSPVYWDYVQVRASAETFNEAEDTAWTAHRVMKDMPVIGTDRGVISRVINQGVPYYLGKDDNTGRYVFTFDARVACEY